MNKIIYLIPIPIIIYLLNYLAINNYGILSIHDQFLFLGNTVNIFNLFNYDDFGFSQSIFVLVNFFDRLLLYIFGNDLRILQKIDTAIYLFKFFILIYLPLYGTFKISKLSKISFKVLLVSLFYSFNSLTLLYFNGQGFSANLIISYSLFPIIFYLFREAIAGRLTSNVISYKILLVLIAIINFSFYFAFVFYIFLALYTIFFIKINKNSVKIIFGILIRSLPLNILFLYLISIYISDLTITRQNTIGGDAAGNISLGFSAPLMLYPSWIFYTVWPRDLLHWVGIYENFFYPLCILPIYYVLLKINGDDENKKFTFIFFVLLVIYCGPQFGFEAINNAFNSIPGMRILRSPDNKIIVAIIFLLYFCIAQKIVNLKGKLFYIFIVFLLVNMAPFFAYNFIEGEYVNNNYKRNVLLTTDMLEVKAFASRLEPGLIYYPNEAFDTFLNGDNAYTGQDILSSMIAWPRINKNLHSFFPKDLHRDEIDSHTMYVLARSDLPKGKILAEQANIDYLTKNMDSIFKNDTYTLYAAKKVNHIVRCILSTDTNIIKADAGCANIDLNIYGKNLFWKYYWSNSNVFEFRYALINFNNFDRNLKFLKVESNGEYKYLYAFYIPTLLLPIIIFMNIMIAFLYLLRSKK